METIQTETSRTTTAAEQTGSASKGRRVVYFDAMNIFACFCVVALHCNALVHSFQDTFAWRCALVVEVLGYFAVPVFFMLSGATLMGYRERYDTKTFMKKRLVRVLVPFVFWSVLFYVLISLQTPFEQGFVYLFFTNGIQATYWFFWPLIAVYLCMPVLSLLKDQTKALWYLVGLAFVLQLCCPLLFTLVGLPWEGDLNVPMLGGYLVYVVLGYLLANTEVSRKARYAIYALAVACLVFRWVYTDVTSTALGYTNRTLFTYLGFQAFFPAVAVFLFFKSIDWSKLGQRWTKLLARVSGCSFGVYLIHYFVLMNIVLPLTGKPLGSGWIRIVLPPILYLACMLLVMLVKKIPVLRRIVP